MHNKFEHFCGPLHSEQVARYLTSLPADTSGVIDLMFAAKADCWTGYKRELGLVFQDEIWIGNESNGGLNRRLDLSLRRLAPKVETDPKILEVNPYYPQQTNGPINRDQPFDLIAARLRLVLPSVDPLTLDFGTHQQYEPSDKNNPHKRPWVASYTYHPGQRSSVTMAVKNLSLERETRVYDQLLTEIKQTLPANQQIIKPDGKSAPNPLDLWLTMNGW